MSESARHVTGMPLPPAAPPADAQPRARRPALRRVATRIGKALLLVLAGYYVLCVLLLVVYRFAAPPITGVQLERRIEAAMSGERFRSA